MTETKEEILDSMKIMLERDEKIEVGLARAQQLQVVSYVFFKNATRVSANYKKSATKVKNVKKEMKTRSRCYYYVIGSVVLVGLVVLGLFLGGVFKKGDS